MKPIGYAEVDMPWGLFALDPFRVPPGGPPRKWTPVFSEPSLYQRVADLELRLQQAEERQAMASRIANAALNERARFYALLREAREHMDPYWDAELIPRLDEALK